MKKIAPYLDGLIAGLQAVCADASARAKKLVDHDKIQPAIAMIDRAPAHQRAAIAKHIITRCGYPERAIEHAYAILDPKPGEPMHAEVALAIMTVATYDIVKRLVKRAKKADAAALAMLFELLLVDERRLSNPYHVGYVKEFALDGLGVRLLEPAHLGPWLAKLQQPGFKELTSYSFGSVLSAWDRRSILKKAKPQQAFELGYAMIGLRPITPSNDPPCVAIEALRTPALEARLAKAVARNPKRKKRFAAMIASIDS